MSSDHRSRSEGWQHAKISGHRNEEIVCDLINKDKVIQHRILKCAHMSDRLFCHAFYGGINETEVDSVLGDKTKSKTDIKVILDTREIINISLKKERGGQVYLISPERFIKGFEKQYSKKIPDEVKRAIGLFWGCEEDVISIISRYSVKYKDYEIKKHRLVADTLSEYDINLSSTLIEWFSNNISDLFSFCFSKGLAKDPSEWADLVWYRNEISEDGEDIDTLININVLCSVLENKATYGPKNGGTTIQLPFGMVQWHSPTKKIPGDMQFHHSFEKMMESYKNSFKKKKVALKKSS